MTVCNMSIEGGARAGMVAPDETTFAYLEGRPHAPSGAAWDEALAYWATLPTDDGAAFDNEVRPRGAPAWSPHVTWGTNPAQVAPIDGRVPDPDSFDDPGDREAAARALGLHGARGRHAAARGGRRHGLPRARAPTRASRTSGPRPPCSRGATSTPGCGPWSCPARTG